MSPVDGRQSAEATLAAKMVQQHLPIEQLNKLKEEAYLAGSERSRQRQHDRGKILAR
ncbi:hypothetical protein BH18ACT4_BH18ACT4_15830 [soil metagenome]